MLLLALVFYLKHEVPDYEQNFPMITELLHEGSVSEENDKQNSMLDMLFKSLEDRNPGYIALKYYCSYR